MEPMLDTRSASSARKGSAPDEALVPIRVQNLEPDLDHASPPRGRMGWDRRRRVHPPLLAVQFGVCVGCWVAVVMALGGPVSRAGLVASFLTASVLVAVTWILAKLGLPPDQVPSAPLEKFPGTRSRRRADGGRSRWSAPPTPPEPSYRGSGWPLDR